MGKHTAYWQHYLKTQVRATLRLLAAIVVWIAATILIALAHEPLGSAFLPLMGAAFAGLVLSLVILAKGAYRVTCPECGAGYRRHKWGGQCPSCGLKLLQEDP